MKTELITVPTFCLKQPDTGLRDITVLYYSGFITLQQESDYIQPNIVDIDTDLVEALFKEIKRHRAEAEMVLNK